MNITNLGIGSGLPLEDLVTAFINAEAIPQEIRLQTKQESLSLELSGVGSFKSSLSTFQSILEKLSAENAFNQQVLTSSSEAIEVKSNGFASNGAFDVDVQQLAQGSRQKSQSFTSSADVVGNGILTFTAGTNTFDVTVGAADDLSTIRDKINEQAENFGLTANIINSDAGSFLVFNSEITGTANNLTITSSDPSLDAISTNNVSEKTAQDAIIFINNNQVTSQTNEFKNVIEDVTITAKAETLGTTAKVTIAQDAENGQNLIKEFVEGFNNLMTDLTGLGAPKQGRLAFDPNVRQVKQQMTDIALKAVSGLSGSIGGLTDIGVEINRSGLLEISQSSSSSLLSGQVKLDNALGSKLKEVGELFASDNGIAKQMSDLADTYIKSDGVLTQRADTLTKRLADVDNEWTKLEERLRSYEDTLRKQFASLDGIVAGYNATGSWLTSTLKSLAPQTSD